VVSGAAGVAVKEKKKSCCSSLGLLPLRLCAALNPVLGIMQGLTRACGVSLRRPNGCLSGSRRRRRRRQLFYQFSDRRRRDHVCIGGVLPADGKCATNGPK
jgi:hypothetical protein